MVCPGYSWFCFIFLKYLLLYCSITAVFSLVLGQCSFFTCHLYEYHLIEKENTWHEAQTYCREKHTDLATVLNMTDVSRLPEPANNQDEAWIGLYNEPGIKNRKWQWSLPGVEFDKNKSMWRSGEPNGHSDMRPENCVQMRNNKWLDFHCTVESKFICYDGENMQLWPYFAHSGCHPV